MRTRNGMTFRYTRRTTNSNPTETALPRSFVRSFVRRNLKKRTGASEPRGPNGWVNSTLSTMICASHPHHSSQPTNPDRQNGRPALPQRSGTRNSRLADFSAVFQQLGSDKRGGESTSVSDRTADPMGMHNPASVRSVSQSQGNTPPWKWGVSGPSMSQVRSGCFPWFLHSVTRVPDEEGWIPYRAESEYRTAGYL